MSNFYFGTYRKWDNRLKTFHPFDQTAAHSKAIPFIVNIPDYDIYGPR